MTPGPARRIVTALPSSSPTPIALPIAIMAIWRGTSLRFSPSFVDSVRSSTARGRTLAIRSLEQLRREFREVVAPVQPRVRALALDEHGIEAVLLQQRHRILCRRDQPVVFAGAEPEEVEAFFERGVVERGDVALLPRVGGRRRRRDGGRRAAAAVDDARAEHADVRELLEIRNRDVQRLVAAHRVAGDRAALA